MGPQQVDRQARIGLRQDLTTISLPPHGTLQLVVATRLRDRGVCWHPLHHGQTFRHHRLRLNWSVLPRQQRTLWARAAAVELGLAGLMGWDRGSSILLRRIRRGVVTRQRKTPKARSLARAKTAACAAQAKLPAEGEGAQRHRMSRRTVPLWNGSLPGAWFSSETARRLGLRDEWKLLIPTMSLACNYFYPLTSTTLGLRVCRAGWHGTLRRQSECSVSSIPKAIRTR